MKHFIKKSPKDCYECIEACPFRNSAEFLEIHRETEGHHFRSLIMIGSGECQRCEHHKNNNRIEEFGKNYDISRGGIRWIECDKLLVNRL